jgi:hypothetical protein
LFAEGEVTVELGDDVRTVTREAFLANPRVQNFAQLLRSKFHETLAIAIECAREHPLHGRQTAIEVLLTGGGNSLPMVKDLVTNPPISWTYQEASPEIPDGPLDDEFRVVRRQLAVAIGGAVRDLPHETVGIRVQGLAAVQ